MSPDGVQRDPVAPPAGGAPTRCRRRPIEPGAARPSEMLAAWFVAGIAWLGLAAASAVANALTDTTWLHWLSLHLAFVGGVSQLVLGAGQFFSCAFLATSPPSRRFAGVQLGVWNAGVVLVAVGVPSGQERLVEAGGVAIALGLILFAAALRGMRRRSLQQARWALRWYQVSAASLGAGALLGVAMARGTAWSHGSLLGAHVALNVAGWFGTAIVGTLHTFFPSLTQTRLRLPRLQGPAFLLWTAGVWALAAGAALGLDAAMVAGWLGLGASGALLGANLLASRLAAPVELALPARLIALGQLFLPAGVAVALVATWSHGAVAPFTGPERSLLAALLLMGWVGLTVAGSLLHLLAVLARVRRFARAMPAPRPARDRLIVAAAGVSVVAVAATARTDVPVAATAARSLAAMVAVVLGVRVTIGLVQAVRPAGRGGR